MAKFKFKVTTNVDGHFSAKVSGAITDADVGKPVKLMTSSTDTYILCGVNDGIDAFIVAVDPSTADGLPFCTLKGNQVGDRMRCVAGGAMNVGDLVKAAAPAAAGTAEATGLPKILTHTLDGTDVAGLIASIKQVNWRVISASTTDGSIDSGDETVIIERL